MSNKGITKRKDSPFYQISIYHQGRHHRFTTKTTSIRMAERIYNKRKSQLIAGDVIEFQPDKMTLKELSDLYLKYSKTKKRSFTRDEGLVKNLLAYFGPDTRAHKIKAFHVEQYQTMRKSFCFGKKKDKKLAPATINKEVMCLRTMYNKAIQWGRLKENPTKTVQMFKANNQIVRFLTREEIKKLLEVCRPYMRDIVTFAINTGLRRGEILGLKWEDVDLERNIIHVRNTKNGEDRKLPINSTVQVLLRPLKKPSGRVFLSPGGRELEDVKKGFKAALQKAGILRFRFHDLRHTFASHLVMAGVDIMTVRDLLGHKSLEMTLRYAHLSPNHKSAAVAQLEKAYTKPYTQEKIEAVT